MPVRKALDVLANHPKAHRVAIDVAALLLVAFIVLSSLAFRDTRRLSADRVEVSRAISRQLCREINRINARDRIILTRAGATELISLIDPPRDCGAIPNK